MESVSVVKDDRQILEFIGVNGGIITFIITCIALYPVSYYIVAFIIGAVVNIQINRILKSVFKEPRPVVVNKPSNTFDEMEIKEKWGFPSGHAQTTSYAFVFLLLVKPRKTVFLLLLGGSLCISVIQRYVYNKHTILQLLAGLFIGAVFAIFYVWGITVFRPYTYGLI
jgi:membrane-associated phospholipid phosphatase